MRKKPFSAVPLDLWPQNDRNAWIAARQPGSIFDNPGKASKWRSDTVRTAAPESNRPRWARR